MEEHGLKPIELRLLLKEINCNATTFDGAKWVDEVEKLIAVERAKL